MRKFSTRETGFIFRKNVITAPLASVSENVSGNFAQRIGSATLANIFAASHVQNEPHRSPNTKPSPPFSCLSPGTFTTRSSKSTISFCKRITHTKMIANAIAVDIIDAM